ncbi:MAG: dethiobiotin synthase [Pseudomonadota bacterium]
MTPLASRLSPPGFFVTGTDTGVGKTLVTCALLRAFAARGKRVVGMKPVAAGAVQDEGGLRNQDVEQILAAGNIAAPRRLVNPYCFEAPIAPHIAASAAGVSIDLAVIQESYAELACKADIMIVEGAGGFCVPLSAREDMADLAQCLGLPVLLVVGMRLGCINHALLTAQAIRARGLRLAGWLANHIDPALEQADANVAALAQRLHAPLIARIAFARDPDPRRVAAAMDVDQLLMQGFDSAAFNADNSR